MNINPETPNFSNHLPTPNLKNMSFKFEKLIIWQKAVDFGEEINILSSNFPKKEIGRASCRERV